MKKILKILATTLALSIFLSIIYYQESRPHDLEVYYLDVGQGDAVLIRTPDNKDILIDGGPDDKILLELGQVLPFWDRDIELMILTHPHEDHIAGLLHVLSRYKIDEVMYNQVDYENDNYKVFQEIIIKNNIKHKQSFYGDKILLDNNIYLETIFPFKNIDLNDLENINNTSIVNRLVFNDNKFLFTGDSELEIEEMIIENDINIESDVLKAGHHGSKTASSKNFLEKVKPKQAIIQCGQGNKFNHPHFVTLYNLEKLKIPVLRNDQDGRIMCSSNGVAVKCEKML